MKRRNFLKKLPVLSAVPFTLSGVPINLMAGNNSLKRMAAASTNDRVLIIIQMHGGNDGLNTVIPIAEYDRYYNARANVAIPENGARRYIKLDGTLAVKDQVGLHPDMVGMKELYDQGKSAIVQGVSYQNNNGSHFRGRDILFMGGGADDYLGSGWVGRYFEQDNLPLVYPNDFPNPEMLDPLALEFGNEVSLIFHQQGNIPTSISINDPESFFNLVDNLPGFDDIEGLDPRGVPPAVLDNSPYGKELNWILGLEQKSDDYAERLIEVYGIGDSFNSGVTYPQTYPLNAPAGRLRNPISGQLQIVAKLLAGGCKTKVFLLRIGGFDTHAEQVEKFDATMGNHAALLYHLASAMKAFQADLKVRGIEDRVLTFTTSEFGRRIFSNGSFGTDHGTGIPVLLFGKWVKPGVVGTNPDLTKGNVELQYDYRQVYASILKDWMEVDAALVDQEMGVFWGDYPGRGTTLPIINTNITSTEVFINERFKLNDCFPNPARNEATFSFYINNSAQVSLKLIDLNGKLMKEIMNERKDAGEHSVKVDLNGISPGTYIYKIEAGLLKDSKKIIVIG